MTDRDKIAAARRELAESRDRVLRAADALAGLERPHKRIWNKLHRAYAEMAEAEESLSVIASALEGRGA